MTLVPAFTLPLQPSLQYSWSLIIIIIIIIIILGLNALRSPMSHLFLTGEFPSYWDWLWCPGLCPYWCPSPFPSLSILDVFHSLLYVIGFQSCFFFTADVSPPVRSTLHLLTF